MKRSHKHHKTIVKFFYTSHLIALYERKIHYSPKCWHPQLLNSDSIHQKWQNILLEERLHFQYKSIVWLQKNWNSGHVSADELFFQMVLLDPFWSLKAFIHCNCIENIKSSTFFKFWSDLLCSDWRTWCRWVNIDSIFISFRAHSF